MHHVIWPSYGNLADGHAFCLQLLIVFASGYGQRPSLLDKMPPVEQLETGASARQYHTNQMWV